MPDDLLHLFPCLAHESIAEGNPTRHKGSSKRLPVCQNASVCAPRFSNEREVNTDSHAISGKAPQLRPIQAAAEGRNRNTLNYPGANAILNAPVNVAMKAVIVGVN